jgi:hypothetical protein
MKALIKNTGELLEVKSMYTQLSITIDFPSEIDIESKSLGTVEYQHDGSKLDYDNVELSDGNLYKKEELVIGIENIREYKIKNLI